MQVVDYQFFLTGLNVTTSNGQMFYTPDNKPHEIGDRFTVRPTASPDRNSVSLDLHVKRTTLVSQNIPLIPVQIPVPQVMEGPGNATTQLGQPVVMQMFLQQPQFNTIELKQQCNVPVGKTVLMVAGTEKRQTSTESVPPIVGKIPYLNRLFRNTAYATENYTTFVLVTPQIVTNSEPRDVDFRNIAPSGN